MTTRLIASASITAAVVLSGCAAETQSPPPVRPLANSAETIDATVAIPTALIAIAPEPNFDPTTALAKRTEDYSATMEQLIAQRKPEVQKLPVTPPTPSRVEWTDPKLMNEPTALDLIKSGGESSPETSIDASGPTNEAVSLVRAETVRRVESVPAASSADMLRQTSAQRVKEYPRDVANHLENQLAQFLNGEPVPQLSTIASLPTEDREMLAAVMDGLSNFRNTLRSDNNMLLSKKIRPLLEMAERLRSQAELSIPTATLCREVRKFGDFDPIEPARFSAHKSQDVILYLEVENFAASRNAQNKWETRLSQEIVLYTETGAAVWSEKTQKLADTSRNRRRDFFIARKLRLPAELGVGRYVLKVTVIDEHANRVAEASVPIVLVAQ